jgi:hypothetical protein
MRFSTIAEVMQMSHKVAFEGIKARVVQVGKQFKGTSTAGKDWTKQDLDLEDSTGTITARVWNHDALPHTFKGQEVTILAHSSDRGVTGVYAFDGEYQGKVTRHIKVTDTGEIALIGASAPSSHPQQQSRAQPQTHAASPASSAAAPRHQPQQAQKPAPTPQDKFTPEQHAAQDAKNALARQVQLANMLERNLDAAVFVAGKFNKKYAGKFRAMDTEDIRAMAMTMQIACEHQGVHSLMPTTVKKEEAK